MKPGSFVFVALTLAATVAVAGTDVRREMRLPQLPGYRLVRYDPHMHTVFSDGQVWPTHRVDEAWRDGLDAISITEHIEHRPHLRDIPADHNRSFQVALPRAKALGLMLIRGAEITRSLPAGHFNAVFLDDVTPLDTPRFENAVRAAIDQGAFVFWNHPGYPHPDGVARWYPVQTRLIEAGHLHGIEIVNGRHYFPEAHRWCLEKKLTMLGSSDMHLPRQVDDNLDDGRRPWTLVFTEGPGIEAVKQALFARRTVVVGADGRLFGEKEYLAPLFERSIGIVRPQPVPRDRAWTYVQIRNRSSLRFDLALDPPAHLQAPARVDLPPERTVRIPVRCTRAGSGPIREITLPVTITNLRVDPEHGLESRITIRAACGGKIDPE